MRRRTAALSATAVVAALGLFVGFGYPALTGSDGDTDGASNGGESAVRLESSPSASSAATPVPVVRTPRPTPKPRANKSRAPKPAPTSAATASPARTHSSTLLVHRLDGVGDARQVISVVSSGYGTSHATLQGFTRTSSGWKRTFGPWPARIGRNGFAPPGEKREGDGRTPTGSYGFQFMFGTRANPGVHYEYRRVTGPWHVWADDPGTPRYNLWTDTRHQNGGPTPEPMNQEPAYYYSAVIGYNLARTPGMGSAIFLHVSDGTSTAGCVALPQSQLLSVLRWMHPAKSPRIVMGTESAIT